MCDSYWRFWSYYRQTPLSNRVIPSHSASNSQKHKGKLLCCYFVVYLTVCLRVERGREFFLDAKEVTERGPKLGHKNRSPVIFDGVRETVMLYHHVYDTSASL